LRDDIAGIRVHRYDARVSRDERIDAGLRDRARGTRRVRRRTRDHDRGDEHADDGAARSDDPT
jgi:hypothetical protein